MYRWLEYADKWHLGHLTSSGLAFIRSTQKTDNIFMQGVAAMPATSSTVLEYALCFRAMLRAGAIDSDLQKLSPAMLIKVMQAGLTGKGCDECTRPGKWECVCPQKEERYLTVCECATRSQCTVCFGWVDI
jgi:hypothetical protein